MSRGICVLLVICVAALSCASGGARLKEGYVAGPAALERLRALPRTVDVTLYASKGLPADAEEHVACVSSMLLSMADGSVGKVCYTEVRFDIEKEPHVAERARSLGLAEQHLVVMEKDSMAMGAVVCVGIALASGEHRGTIVLPQLAVLEEYLLSGIESIAAAE